MANISKVVTVWKDGNLVGSADGVRTAIMSGVHDIVVKKLKLYFFPTLALSPNILFEHLAGKSLGAFLDKSGVEMVVDDCLEREEPLRYVHGRSESMKGKQLISSVLLAAILSSEDCQDITWLANLPTIYSRFLELPV